jgi:hypothetical protein
MADSNDTEFVGSHLRAKNGYGQNGFQGPSSDTPGKHTASGFLPAVKLPAADDNGQTRNVKSDQYPTTFGMTGPKASPKVGTSNSRRPNEPRTGTHFQR